MMKKTTFEENIKKFDIIKFKVEFKKNEVIKIIELITKPNVAKKIKNRIQYIIKYSNDFVIEGNIENRTRFGL